MIEGEGASPATGERRRSDARRNRAGILSAASRQLSADPGSTMRSVATVAGVSRSTLHRHFPTRADLDLALRSEAISAARAAAEDAVSTDRPPLAALRRVVDALVGIGADYPPVATGTRSPEAEAEVEGAGVALAPLLESLRLAADVSPRLPAGWARTAAGHLVSAALEVGGANPADPGLAAQGLFRTITDPLDRALVILDAQGSLLALNPPAEALLAPGARPRPGERLTHPRLDAVYEDGSHCPNDAYPLAMAVRAVETQPATVRGHREPDGAVSWARIEARVLMRPGGPAYGVVAMMEDVTSEAEWEREHLRAPGQLGRARPVTLDIVRVLDEIPPHLFPDQFVSEARRITGNPVALYVLDIDGSRLLRLAGAEEFPARLDAPLALGPELAADGIPELRARLQAELPGVAMAPMWLRGRAVGVLLSLRGSDDSLDELARHGAAAMELAGGSTDLFDAARRRKETTAAAELQQSLLPPRIARLGSGELAGSVLPSYEVGGDWFDYVENRDGAWVAVADAAGKGSTAAALGGIALAALRAARRSDRSLEEAAQMMHEAVYDVGRPEFFVTALIARWHAVYSTFSWVSCGHPPPVLVRPDDTVEQLMVAPSLPLGLLDRERRFTRRQRRLEDGERLILHSDGITGRRTTEGLFGLDGLGQAIGRAATRSATALARAIQEAVVSASVDPLQDDAVVVVLSPGAPAAASNPDGA